MFWYVWAGLLQAHYYEGGSSYRYGVPLRAFGTKSGRRTFLLYDTEHLMRHSNHEKWKRLNLFVYSTA